MISRADGEQRLLLRPIRSEDAPALQAIVAHLTPEQVRMRFFVFLKTLSHAMAARITQFDYDREMGLVLTPAREALLVVPERPHKPHRRLPSSLSDLAGNFSR
jgi:hypothetical protein